MVGTPQRTVATALEIESWTHSKPFSPQPGRDDALASGHLARELPEHRPEREAGCGKDRGPTQLAADLVDDLLLAQRIRPDDVDRPDDVAAVDEEDEGADHVVEA